MTCHDEPTDVFPGRELVPLAKDGEHLGRIPAIREDTAPLVPLPEPTEAERQAAKEHLAATYAELTELAGEDLPETTPAAPGYTQTEWDRRQVRWLQRSDLAARYLQQHPHLPPAEATRRALIIVRDGTDALHRYLADLAPESITRRLARPMLEVLPSDAGTIYAAMACAPVIEPTKVIPPRRRRGKDTSIPPGKDSA